MDFKTELNTYKHNINFSTIFMGSLYLQKNDVRIVYAPTNTL